MRQLLLAGVCGLVVLGVVLAFLMARYQGYFVEKVKVTANLTTTGDGLPSDADVKFRGILVGVVDEVSVAAKGELQQVHIEMKPEFAGDIPASVTARVVPSNLFAVTSVELVYNGPGADMLHEGSIIEQDTSKGTIALQDTLTTVRNILSNIDPMQFGRVLTTLSYALDGSGRVPGSTVERLDNWLTSVDQAIPDLGTQLGDLAASFHALNQSAPELMDVLGTSVQTAQTIAGRRDQLVSLITGTSATIDKVNDLFARNPNSGKELTSGISDTFGALSEDPSAITRAIANMNSSLRALNTTFHWGPQRQHVWNLGLGFSPWNGWTVADCPRYGELAGPSCATAPAVADPGILNQQMLPRALESAVGLPPLANLPEIPGLPPRQPASSLPALPGLPALPQLGNPFSGTPLEGLFPAIIPPGQQAPAGQPVPEQPAAPEQPVAPEQPTPDVPAAAPITYQDDAALVALLGRRPSTVEYLLLRSSLEGGTLQVTDTGAKR